MSTAFVLILQGMSTMGRFLQQNSRVLLELYDRN